MVSSLRHRCVLQVITTIGVASGVIFSAEHFLYWVFISILIILVEAWKNLWQINQVW
ncbi:MAG: hypothetical protein HQL15_06925 [Candidatus Omnitrophica bacterium]|nr:hypothetical protein [Candidatus Omnitrophota bacterium]